MGLLAQETRGLGGSGNGPEPALLREHVCAHALTSLCNKSDLQICGPKQVL